MTGSLSTGFGDVLGQAFRHDFPTWSAGVTVSYPIGRSYEGASLARAEIERRQVRQRISSLQLQVVETVRQMALRQSGTGVIAGLYALRDRPDAAPGLLAVAVPTLVLVGEHDAVTPAALAEKLVARVRGSKLVTIPGAGHLSNLENPDAFNAGVLAFLKNLR